MERDVSVSVYVDIRRDISPPLYTVEPILDESPITSPVNDVLSQSKNIKRHSNIVFNEI